MSLTGRRVLLVDDHQIAYRRGVVRRTHAGQKREAPVLVGQMPWECAGSDRRLYLYGTVMADPGGGYRMWYSGFPHQVFYAVSEDGLHWQRPCLGRVEYEGSKQNNILPIRLHSPSVVFDPDAADQAWRYKMLGCGKGDGRKGYHVAHSSDGHDWSFCRKNPVLEGSDTCTLSRDSATGEYLAFHKRTHVHAGHVRRLVYLSTSADLQNWSEPRLVMAPDELDDEQVQAEGGINSQFYNMAAFEAGDQWLGLVTHFRFSREIEDTRPAQSPHDGPIDVQLVHSRDGRNWDRCEDRSPVIANGPHSYDRGCILGVANQPVVVGDEMWIYYTAITTTHGGRLPDKQITIARASWPLDRWVSLDAGADGGVVETQVTSPGGGASLQVNADAAEGEIRVEVLAPDGGICRGYEAQACMPVREDGIRQPVRWRGARDLPRTGPIRLRFLMQRARLFSWTVSGPDNE